MMIMDENRLLGSDSENLRKWDVMIRRDRNHPSIIIWSVCNEEGSVEWNDQASNTARSMQNYVHRLDPTRPVTYPAPQGDTVGGINSVIEVRGWNFVPAGHGQVSRQASTTGERRHGTSQRHQHARHLRKQPGDRPRGGLRRSAEPVGDEFRDVVELVCGGPWLSGGFVWTGFDYRGEPTPFGWPCINSHFGVLDTCGFPKDNFYYYKAWWTTNTVLHLLPHWNWPGREGHEFRVDAMSNCKEIELFLNGESLGRKTMKRNSKLTWNVKYAPGTLSAKGFDAAGKVIADSKVETTGDATRIELTPDRKMINADGEDVAVFSVTAFDAQGGSCRWRRTRSTSPSKARARSSVWATAIRAAMNRTRLCRAGRCALLHWTSGAGKCCRSLAGIILRRNTRRLLMTRHGTSSKLETAKARSRLTTPRRFTACISR